MGRGSWGVDLLQARSSARMFRDWRCNAGAHGLRPAIRGGSRTDPSWPLWATTTYVRARLPALRPRQHDLQLRRSGLGPQAWVRRCLGARTSGSHVRPMQVQALLSDRARWPIEPLRRPTSSPALIRFRHGPLLKSTCEARYKLDHALLSYLTWWQSRCSLLTGESNGEVGRSAAMPVGNGGRMLISWTTLRRSSTT